MTPKGEARSSSQRMPNVRTYIQTSLDQNKRQVTRSSCVWQQTRRHHARQHPRVAISLIPYDTSSCPLSKAIVPAALESHLNITTTPSAPETCGVTSTGMTGRRPTEIISRAPETERTQRLVLDDPVPTLGRNST